MKIMQRNLNSSAFVVWEMKRNVSVVRFKFRCNILISGKVIKEMPGSVASGTRCIIRYEILFKLSARHVAQELGSKNILNGRFKYTANYLNSCGPSSSVGIATDYGLDGPGIESRWVARFFRTCPDRPCGPPSRLYNGHRVFPGGKERSRSDADPTPPSSAVVKKE